MDKTVKWQDTPPPSETDSSDSPTLSDHKPSSTSSSAFSQIKRKKSNIFSKLRKSILGSTSEEDHENNNDSAKDTRNVSLKRALSMDAGLQNRISQLNGDTLENSPPLISAFEKIGKDVLRRSKSLISSPIEPNEIIISGFGSRAQSPKTENQSIEANDSILDNCESLQAHYSFSSAQNTIDTLTKLGSIPLSHKIFNCSWLAPTRKSQLFPGQLSLLPNSTILFQCQNATRSIHLKFRFSDVLNIARGTWNNQRNQAFIIDLIRGKRKTWVFVAWSGGQFEQSIESIVAVWKVYCMNQIKNRLDRRRAHLNMKYCRVIKEADRANESGKIEDLWTFNKFINYFINHFHFNSSNDEYENEFYKINNNNIKEKEMNYSLKIVLVDEMISNVIPQVLSSIISDQATSFMTNFRAVQGIVIKNDSGWDSEGKRNFISLLPKVEESSMDPLNSHIKFSKWRVFQRFLLNTPERVIIESNLILESSSFSSTFTINNFSYYQNHQKFKMIYEIFSFSKIKNEIEMFKDEGFTCKLKVTGELCNAIDNFGSQYERDLCNYYSVNYFSPMISLLKAMINESQNEFETLGTELIEDKLLKPPHFRFLKDSIKTKVLKFNLFLTTLILPIIYKFIHFKSFKPARITLISLIILLLLRFIIKILIEMLLNMILQSKQQQFLNVNVIEDNLQNILEELAKDASDAISPIHNLKLKYN